MQQAATDHCTECMRGEGQRPRGPLDESASRSFRQHEGGCIESDVAPPPPLNGLTQSPRTAGRIQHRLTTEVRSVERKGSCHTAGVAAGRSGIAPAAARIVGARSGLLPMAAYVSGLWVRDGHGRGELYPFWTCGGSHKWGATDGTPISTLLYMLKELYPYWLAGQTASGEDERVVLNKFNSEAVARVAWADRGTLLDAIAAAQAAAEPMAQMAAYERAAGLRHCAQRFEERAEELAQVLCMEAGKPIRDARGEVGRLVDTFRVASEEATRLGGEVLPMDVTERARAYRGMWQRVPIGPCGFITPWNFPLNLVAHKVAPALAVGNPFVLKPASATPLGALLIGEVLAELDLPAGAFSILPCSVDDAGPLVEDERLKLLSFTGSHQVGWELKGRAGKKHVQLELGGNAACIVDEDADIEDTVSRLVMGAFYQSGQSCISVQRILVHESVYPELKQQLIDATAALITGDPALEGTFIGPMISEAEAERLQGWIGEAVEAGASLLVGGGREGALLEASLLEGVPPSLSLCREEAFGPVAVLSTFTDFGAALKEVNDSKYGLQAGLFTRDIHKANRAWDELEVGAVIVGDVPSWRVDHMPYGGVKDSGLGREGLRFAMQEQTEMRLLVIRDPQT